MEELIGYVFEGEGWCVKYSDKVAKVYMHMCRIREMDVKREKCYHTVVELQRLIPAVSQADFSEGVPAVDSPEGVQQVCVVV